MMFRVHELAQNWWSVALLFLVETNRDGYVSPSTRIQDR